jgi:hypothetical protein
VEELIKLNPRYELQLEVLKQEYGIAIRSFQGEKLNLMPYGNHARGAKFTDASHKVTKSWKILSMKCVYKFLDSFWKNGCDVQLFCRIRKWKNFLL